MGIDNENVAVGDLVKVAGNSTVDGAPEINATNMLLPDGRELLLSPRAPLRFAGRTIGDGSAWRVTEGDASRPERGLFWVWSTTFSSPGLLAVREYPLTEEARRAGGMAIRLSLQPRI